MNKSNPPISKKRYKFPLYPNLCDIPIGKVCSSFEHAGMSTALFYILKICESTGCWHKFTMTELLYLVCSRNNLLNIFPSDAQKIRERDLIMYTIAGGFKMLVSHGTVVKVDDDNYKLDENFITSLIHYRI